MACHAARRHDGIETPEHVPAPSSKKIRIGFQNQRFAGDVGEGLEHFMAILPNRAIGGRIEFDVHHVVLEGFIDG